MSKIPYIKTLDDFADEVKYCFYIIGYIDAIRGETTYNPTPQYQTAYEEGLQAGEYFVQWFLLAAINNKN